MAKSDNLIAQAMALVAKAGIEVTEEVKSVGEINRDYAKKKEQDSRAIEGVLLSEHHVHAMMIRVCKWCGEKFQTNYCYLSFCSDRCRNLEFIDHFKVDPKKLQVSPGFWEYEEPIVVSPKFLHGLYAWAKHLVQEYESLDQTSQLAAAEEFEEGERQSLIASLDSAASSLGLVLDVPVDTSQPGTLPDHRGESGDGAPPNPSIPLLDLEIPDFSF